MTRRTIPGVLDAQEDIVRWWQANVRRPGKPVIGADSAPINRDDAEAIIGYSHQQISRWAKKLA